MQTPRFILLTLLALFPCVLLADVSVALPNPGFENDFSGWIIGPYDGGMSRASTGAAWTGTHGLEVVDDSASTGSSLYSQKVAITPGSTHRLRFWNRIVSGGGIGVYLIFYNASQQVIAPADGFMLSIPASRTQWTRFELDATAPAGATSVAIHIHSYNANLVTAHFDDFVLSELLSNPGFEGGLDRWTVDSTDNGMSAVVAAAARTGTSGLRVTDGSVSGGSSVYSKKFPVTPATAYELTCWARLVQGNGIGVYLIFYDASQQPILPSDAFAQTIPSYQTDWKRVVVKAVAPANAASVAIWVHSYYATLVTADFDDFTLIQSAPGFSSGFENNLNDWIVGTGDGGMSQSVSAAKRSGGFGLRVTDANAGGGSDLLSPKLPTLQGRGYELSFWARTVSGSGMGVYLRYFDANQAALPGQPFPGAHLGIPADQTQWRRLTLSHVAPSGAAYVAIWLHSYGANIVTTDLDDLLLREVPRSFVENFPKQSPDKAFPALKVYQADGAVYRTPVEDWSGATQRVSSGAWLTWLNGQKTAIDQWMAGNADRVTWKAGWGHDFVSPVDGSFLTWTQDVPGEDVSFLYSPSDPNVAITPKIFGGWVFGFRSRHASRIQDAARLYRLTGDVAYANWAAGQLDFYADNYQLWPEHTDLGHPARLSAQPLDEAVNLIRLTDAARLLFDWAGSTRRQAWYAKLFKPEAELLDRSYQSVHNIAAWVRSAQAQVALLYGDDALWLRAVDGPHGLRAQLRLGVSGDYIWYEQSMGYNDYVVNATNQLLTFAGLLGRTRDLEHEASILQNLLLSPLTIRFPDGHLPNPADVNGTVTVPSSLIRGTYRVLPTTLGLLQSSTQRNWDTLVDPAVPTGGSTALPTVVSKHLASTRFALMKKSSWQVFFHYGQLHPSHAQAEALNWSASFEGVNITMDPGTVGYGSPLHTNYYSRGLNHNVPLVNSEGQTPWKRGELLAFNTSTGVMTGEQIDYQADSAAHRTLRIESDGRLIDETTVIQIGGGAKLGLALHLEGTPNLPAAFQPASNFATGRSAPFGYWQNVKSATFQNEAEIDVTFIDGLVLRVRFATPGTFTVYQGSSPGYPPNRRAGFYIEKEGTAAEASFVTEFTPFFAD